jgi:ankyrin repeat protein/uncharacterized protein (DUF2267 family)
MMIQGKPGCGKSVISRYLFEEVVPKYDQRDTIVLYYGFNGSQKSRQSISALLSSLISQLIKADRKLLLEIVHVWRDRRDHGISWDERALLKVLKLILNASGPSTITCIIDALNECRTPTLDFLQMVREITMSSPKPGTPAVKFIILSQPFDLTIFMRVDPLLVDLDSMPDLYQDVKKFIDHEFETRLNSRNYADIELLVKEKLVEKSDGMYIIVKCLVDRLCSTTASSKKHIEELLNTLPSDIETVYNSIWKDIPPKDKNRASKIMALALNAAQPMTLMDIATAVAVFDAEDRELQYQELPTESQDMKGDLLRLFRSLLRIAKAVDISHQTVKEFFISRKPKSAEQNLEYSQELYDASKAHSLIASTCLRYLTFFAFDLRKPFSLYALQNFQYHLAKSNMNDAAILVSQLEAFLKPESNPAAKFFWGEIAPYERPWRIFSSEYTSWTDHRKVIDRVVAEIDGKLDSAWNQTPKKGLSPAMSFACMYDIPWVLKLCAENAARSGNLTYLDLFGHIYECLWFRSSRCLPVLADLFRLFEPDRKIDAQVMFDKAGYFLWWPGSLISHLPNILKADYDDAIFMDSPPISTSFVARNELEPLLGVIANRDYFGPQMVLQGGYGNFLRYHFQTIISTSSVLCDTITFFNLAVIIHTPTSTKSNLLDSGSYSLIRMLREEQNLSSALLIAADSNKLLAWEDAGLKLNVFHLVAQNLNGLTLQMLLKSRDAVQIRKMVTQGDPNGATPLHYACSKLKGGGKLNASAYNFRRSGIIRDLLDAGANKATRDTFQGETALDWLVRVIEPDWSCSLKDSSRIVALEDLSECISLLECEPDDLFVPSPRSSQLGTLPLNLAAFHWPADTIQEILARRPASLHITTLKDRFGRNPLHFAAARGFTGTRKVIELLLGVGFDLNKRDKYGRRPLYYAVKFGRSSSVLELLQAEDKSRKLKRDNLELELVRAQKKRDMHIRDSHESRQRKDIEAQSSPHDQSEVESSSVQNVGAEISIEDATFLFNMLNNTSSDTYKSTYGTNPTNEGSPRGKDGPLLQSDEADFLISALSPSTDWTLSEGLKAISKDLGLKHNEYALAYSAHRRSEPIQQIDSDDECAEGWRPRKKEWLDPLGLRDLDMHIKLSHGPRKTELRYRHQRTSRRIRQLINKAAGREDAIIVIADGIVDGDEHKDEMYVF